MLFSSTPKGTSARLSECIMTWRTLTSDPQILSIVSGYKISFFRTPFQNRCCLPRHRVRRHSLYPGKCTSYYKKEPYKKPFYQRRFLQPPVSCTQKGTFYASGDRPKFFEQVHCKRAFPDGKPQLCQDIAFTRRFYDKYRFKRCLPFCACPQVVPKVPSLHLGGKMLPVQSFPIRPVFSTQNFYKSSKTCLCFPEEEGHSSPYIPGRFSPFSCNSGGSCKKYPAGSDSPSVAWLYNKPQEIITDSNISDNIRGFQIDSMCMMISLPADKSDKILYCCRRLLISRSITLRNLASLIGLLESSRPTIIHYFFGKKQYPITKVISMK